MSELQVDPLFHCPEALRPRFAARAAKVQAGTSLRAAIDLRCLDCCCWQPAEVKRCEINACSLWAIRPFQADSEVDSGQEKNVE